MVKSHKSPDSNVIFGIDDVKPFLDNLFSEELNLIKQEISETIDGIREQINALDKDINKAELAMIGFGVVPVDMESMSDTLLGLDKRRRDIQSCIDDYSKNQVWVSDRIQNFKPRALEAVGKRVQDFGEKEKGVLLREADDFFGMGGISESGLLFSYWSMINEQMEEPFGKQQKSIKETIEAIGLRVSRLFAKN